MKKIILSVIFILMMSLLNISGAVVGVKYPAYGFCENCNDPMAVGQMKPIEGGAYHGGYCSKCNRLMILDIWQGLKREAHDYDNSGVCKKCGYKVTSCKHEGTVRRYIPNEDRQTHRVICENCNTVINEAETCSPNQENCEKCSVKKSVTFYIPTRVYYIDETGLKAVGSQGENTSIDVSLENATGTPYFYWTMSTAGSSVFNSAANNSYSSAASDGTIRFWYNGSGFDAQLEPSPKNLSGEVAIRITLQVDDVEISQTIRIIKNGSPESSCIIYFKSKYVTINDDMLTLLIKTDYVDFSEDDVRRIREVSPDELPFYTVKDKKIEIESLDKGSLKIENYELKEATEDITNGYMAKVKIKPEKLGSARVKYRLTTEYNYMNHETIEKEREGILLVNIVEKLPEEGDGSDGGGGGSSGGGGGDSGEDDGRGSGKKASGGLAFIGVMGLLIIAFFGSKMLNHR